MDPGGSVTIRLDIYLGGAMGLVLLPLRTLVQDQDWLWLGLGAGQGLGIVMGIVAPGAK